MKSKTKYEVDAATIQALFEKADIPGAENIAPLGDGEFNSVYAVDAGRKSYAIKIAPKPDAEILTYEKGMMAQEVFYYGLMEQAGIHVPKIYFSDFTRKLIPTEYFIMQRLEGEKLGEGNLTAQEWQEIHARLARMAARMHATQGEQFGFRQNGLHATWHLALRSMVTNLIEDCKRLGHRTPRGERLLREINHHQHILESVESRLINFDIWPSNIVAQQVDGELKLSWIDPERCLWGDRIADFVCLDFMNMDLDKKTTALEAYNQVTDYPIQVGEAERIRYAIMLGYLGLVMEVEKYARYNLFLPGWWRNVAVSKMNFDRSFQQLEKLNSH